VGHSGRRDIVTHSVNGHVPCAVCLFHWRILPFSCPHGKWHWASLRRSTNVHSNSSTVNSMRRIWRILTGAYRGFRLGGSTGTTWVFSCKLSCRERLERVLADSRPPIISRCRLQLVRLLCSHCGTRTGRKCNSVISIKDDAKKYQREEDYSAKQRVKKLTSLCLGRWPKNTQKVQKMSTMLH